jgi:hypothetical protein
MRALKAFIRRWVMVIAAGSMAAPAAAQVGPAAIVYTPPVAGSTSISPLASPFFTGQWTVNGSLCAAGQVVQGGNPTTCTSTPTITSLTTGNGTTTAPSIRGAVATDGFLFDTAPAAGPRFSLYDTSIGALYGLLSNSFEDTNLTGRGLQVIGRTTSLNDNGTLVLRPQATNPSAWNTHPAMLFGSYDGGYDIGTAEHWAAFCYSTGVSWCDFAGSLNGVGERKPMWELMGNSRISHNVIRSSTQSIDNVSTIGYSLNNAWTSTAGFPTQWSPAFAWCGSAWKSNATAASQADCFKAENRTLTGSTVTTQTWALGSSVNGGAYTDVLTVTSAGVLSGPTYASSGSGMAVANVGANSCGTTTATIAGNNNAGEVTVGATSGTQCRIAFTVAASTKWQCTASDESTAVLTRAVPVDTTHVDLLGVFTAGDVITYVCFPR